MNSGQIIVYLVGLTMIAIATGFLAHSIPVTFIMGGAGLILMVALDHIMEAKP